MPQGCISLKLYSLNDHKHAPVTFSIYSCLHIGLWDPLVTYHYQNHISSIWNHFVGFYFYNNFLLVLLQLYLISVRFCITLQYSYIPSLYWPSPLYMGCFLSKDIFPNHLGWHSFVFSFIGVMYRVFSSTLILNPILVTPQNSSYHLNLSLIYCLLCFLCSAMFSCI